MGCLLFLLSLIAPRLVIVVLAIFTRALETAFDSVLWPILGFLFLPFTTLAYTWAQNRAGGVEGPFWIALMVIAVLVDVGALREGGRRRKRE